MAPPRAQTGIARGNFGVPIQAPTKKKKAPPVISPEIRAKMWELNPSGSMTSFTGFNGPPPPTPGGGGGPPGSVDTPGYDPDYANLILGDANVIAGFGDLDAYNSRLIQSRQGAIRRAIIAAGIAPKGALADVDETTIAAARENNFSAAAELGRTRGRRSTDLEAKLADRGILGSGALAGGQSRLQEDYERGTSNVLSQLLNQIAGVESEVSDKQLTIAQQRARLREEAAQRLQADPRYRPMGKGKARLDAASGLYVTDDGRWYDRDGNRVDGPSGGGGGGQETVDLAPSLAAAVPVAPVENAGVRRTGHRDYF